MYKNYIKFLATSVIILVGGGTALNSNCYCMEEITTDNINEINTILKYNGQELVQTSDALISDVSYWYIDEDKINNIKQMITNGINNNETEVINNFNNFKQLLTNYINNIRAFYNSQDKDTLNELIKLQVSEPNNIYVNKVYNMSNNIMRLHDYHFITTEECEKLLKFNLFLNIITNIQNNGNIVYLNKYRIPYEVLEAGTRNIIRQLTKIFIEKNFILDDPKTWIAKDILQQRIYMAMEDIINYFNKLPITKEITNTGITTSNIPVSFLTNTVNDAIEEFFSTEEVRNRLVHELTLEFKAAQANRAYQKMGHVGFHSKEIGKKVFSYVSPEAYPRLGNKLIKDINVLKGLFNFPDRIPAIVLSYLREKILDGQLVPDYIIKYIKSYNVLPEGAAYNAEDSGEEEEDNYDEDEI